MRVGRLLSRGGPEAVGGVVARRLPPPLIAGGRILPLGQGALLLGLLAAWQWLAPLAVRTGPDFFPLPSHVFQGFVTLLPTRDFWESVAVSIGRVAGGFAVAGLLGIPLGICMGYSRRVELACDTTVELFRPLPAMAWIPIAILWFGVGNVSSVFLVWLGAFFPIVVNSAAGVRATGRIYQRAARTLGAGPLLTLRKVVLPGALPYVILGCRIGIGVGWMVIVAGEMVGAQSGLGFLIMKFRSFARIDWVVNCMVAIGLIGLGLDALIVRWQRRAVPWWGKEGT